MTAALALGLTTALLWGFGALASAISARAAGPWVPLLWSSLLGFFVCCVLALPYGLPDANGGTWLFVGLSSLGWAAAKLLYLTAMRGGHISVVTPIVACDGVVAAILVVIAGGAVPPGLVLAIALILAATSLLAASGTVAVTDEVRTGLVDVYPIELTVLLAGGAAIGFGGVFYFSGEATDMDAIWVVGLSQVLAGLGALAVCIRTGTLTRSEGVMPWIVVLALVESVGFATYIWGAAFSLITAAVAASQYAAVAALIGILWSGERLSRVQLLAVGLLIAAATTVALGGA